MIVSGKARLAGVLGWPVSHSRSPRLHGFWLEKLGIDGAYLPLAVAPENLESVICALPRMGFAGANVTVPHKEAVMRLVDRLDPLAARIGAVNTLVVGEDGALEGRNTDSYGFFQNLRQGCPGWVPSSGPAAVIGAGGAARAVVAALADAGVPEIRLANRSRERAEALAADLGGPVRVVEWAERADMLENCALLVNTTTLGMTGQSNLDLDLSALPQTALVNDIVYVPLETDLLARARARGNQVVDGLGMLLHQAVPGFAAWFGRRPEVTEELRSFVLSS
ncbi:Shikimate dehydrogenase [Magnetospirillum sp. XM-1]|uniref:shikimate dehydrogenase n=1 Tax=Magnetospirillum sp. XM-1 TaxID=1663591 RepID=UPI00073DB99E|nr:shikimate dehydrogenase [Magnetospirillum sp. XM-1]CUW37900.1 Shikimate dehydrogenase [Magnetospirillum sp. XM-1]